ncbi:tRNA 2-thiocytidine biosynthesis TtcA family protein [Christensenella intestinihominis]|uniref:tRNA 2-thiocytidine biosynthesis TtcA family protein n=1 Tax=Christensenella intestinihominis TaxID=1851429 RepID=UPI000B1D9C73|nr:ATP-binding protein [Christensenella intestinihominis]
MRKILGALRRADERFSMIASGDRIAVGLSGGKDSMLLLYALHLYQKYAKKDYDLLAITVDLGFGNYATGVMREYADSLGVPLHILETNISEIVFDIRKEKNPCSLCAKMRKGAFYEKATELSCTKAAFAHHGDDVIETLLLSLMYEGRMNTFSPKSYLSRREITLVRPFVFLRERDIVSAVGRLDIPIAKNPCPIDFSTKREQAKEIVKYLNSLYPGTADNMLNAVKTTQTYNLWNKDWDF